MSMSHKRCAGAMLFSALFARCCFAVVTTGDPANFVLDPGEAIPGADGLNHDGVVSLGVHYELGAFNEATGVLLRGGRWILTAAHVLDQVSANPADIDIDRIDISASDGTAITLLGDNHHTFHHDYFEWGLVTGSNVGNGFSTDGLAGYDLALIDLGGSTVFENIPGARIFNGDATGREFVILGYGLSGNGVNQANDRLKRYAKNKFEVGIYEYAQDDGENGTAREYTNYFFDFDAPSGTTDAQQFFQPATASPIPLNGEGMNAPGDSGGPLFVKSGDSWQVAGIVSYRRSSDVDVIPGRNSSFGEVGAAVKFRALNLTDDPTTPFYNEAGDTIRNWILHKTQIGVSIKEGIGITGSWGNPNDWSYSTTPSATMDVYIDPVISSGSLSISGPTASETVVSLTVGGTGGGKIFLLNQSAVALTTTEFVAVSDNGLIQVSDGSLVADSVSLSASPAAQFIGQLQILGNLGASSLSVANDIVVDSGGLLDFFGTPTTTSLAANRIIINGTGAFRTNRVGGGSLDLDWEINGFVNFSFPNVETSTEDFVILPGRSLTMTDGLIATQTFRIDSGASADVTDTFYGSVIIAATVEVMGTFAMDHGQVTGANLTVTPSGVLDIGLGGLTAYQNFAKLDMSGTTTLAGTLTLGLIDSFGPAIGDSFDILTFGSLVGAFELVTGLDLGNDTWLALAYGASALTITVQLEGDFDGDGFVGIADLNRVLGAWNQIRPAGAPLTGDWSGEMGSWGSKT